MSSELETLKIKYEELQRKLAESIKDCQRLLQIQVEMNDRLSKFDFPIDDFEGYYDEQRKIEKPYALKRHDEICDELEASNYTETEIVLASVGIWKGIESERKHKNEKLKQLKDIAANEQHWRVEAETEIKDLREKLAQAERERDEYEGLYRAKSEQVIRFCGKLKEAEDKLDAIIPECAGLNFKAIEFERQRNEAVAKNDEDLELLMKTASERDAALSRVKYFEKENERLRLQYKDIHQPQIVMQEENANLRAENERLKAVVTHVYQHTSDYETEKMCRQALSIATPPENRDSIATSPDGTGEK